MTPLKRRVLRLSILLVVAGLAWPVGQGIYDYRRYHRTEVDPANGFLVAPYLQLGDAPTSESTETAEVLWQTLDSPGEQAAPPWKVETRPKGQGDWSVATAEAPFRLVAVPGLVPHRVYRAKLTGLIPGEHFEYRLSRGGSPRFEAVGKARPVPGKPSRVVVFGDTGSGSAAEARVVHRVWKSKPDVVFIAGDLVYWRGRIFEYDRRFFPYFNADKADPSLGAPLMRSTLVLAASGNHDLMARDLAEDPDAQAFFYYWSMPLNGPVVRDDQAGSPALKGSPEQLAAFKAGTGSAYPRMANFSVDVGDVHWTVLDLNQYVDWSDPTLLAWLEADLAGASKKPWRFVVGHQPGFQSGKAHCHEQQMRQLAPIFERNGVSLVFAGHVHNYQRSRPLTFVPKKRETGKYADDYGRVQGDLTVDLDYDGKEKIVPRGIIYLVTGGGGAALHDTERADQEFNANDFTVKFIADRHSLTMLDLTPDEVHVRQVDIDGATLDEFKVRREAPRVAVRPLP